MCVCVSWWKGLTGKGHVAAMHVGHGSSPEHLELNPNLLDDGSGARTDKFITHVSATDSRHRQLHTQTHPAPPHTHIQTHTNSLSTFKPQIGPILSCPAHRPRGVRCGKHSSVALFPFSWPLSMWPVTNVVTNINTSVCYMEVRKVRS